MRQVVKVVTFGNPDVYGNSVFDRYILSYMISLGADFFVHTETINNEEVEFQFWLLSSDPGFSHLRPRFMKGAKIVIINLLSLQTFHDIQAFTEEYIRREKQYVVDRLIFGTREHVPSVHIFYHTNLRAQVEVFTKDFEETLVTNVMTYEYPYEFRSDGWDKNGYTSDFLGALRNSARSILSSNSD